MSLACPIGSEQTREGVIQCELQKWIRRLCSSSCHLLLLLRPVLKFQQHSQGCALVPASRTPTRGKMPRCTPVLSADGARRRRMKGHCLRASAALTLHGVLVARPQGTYLIKSQRGAAQGQRKDKSHVYMQTMNARLKSACLACMKTSWLQSPVETGHCGTYLKVRY